ncbi:MAG: YqgE/AlgH family protein [Schleiferiaceae bacterium]|nr:YqgE/AlgH family protein [Schleiferiaceae bacterium]
MDETLSPGKFLVAQPFLGDPNFERAVIFIVEHNENGTIGFVINKNSSIELASIAPKAGWSAPIKKGGPVDLDSLHYLHTAPTRIKNCHEVAPGIFWGGNFQDVEKGLETGQLNSGNIQFFLGYTGWGPRQLATEIKQGSWLIVDKNYHDLIANELPNLWKTILLETGGDFKLWANAPENPLLN